MSNVTKQQADKIVEYLEAVKKHPLMFIAEDIPSIFGFLQGFISAFDSWGTDLYQEYGNIWRIVDEERGWEFNIPPLWEQMRDAGLSSDEITQEMLAMHLEVWRRIGEKLSQEE